MDKQEGSTLTYSYVDSQRLQEAFFSNLEEKTPPKKKSTLLKISVVLISIFIISILLFILNYELIILPRSGPNYQKNISSLFNENILKSLKLLNADKRLMKKGKSSVYLSIPPGEKLTMKFDFKKPINLHTNILTFWIKKTNIPLNMDIIVKDTRFFSNAQNPKTLKIKKNDNSVYTKIPVYFENLASAKVNLANIKQMKIYLYHKSYNKKTPLTNNSISYWGKNWLLMKDITLSKKGDK